jgi:sarcosine oxidase subunit beta
MGDQTADVVIIGGGCMGASVAYHLTRLGITDVVIVEREPMLGMGSTGRNAGGVRHQFSSEANVRLSIESIRLFERFQEEVGYEIDFHQDGYLFLLSTEAALESFRRSVEMQRSLGVEVELISADEAARLAPGLKVDGVIAATFCARDGICDPNGVSMGFARVAQSAGVRIYRETEVTGVKVESGKIAAVETSGGAISTRTVVNAAGPYARKVGEMAGINIPIFPFRRHIFITKPFEALTALNTIAGPHRYQIPNSHIMVIDFESTFYFHREGAGVLFGMSDADEPSSYNTDVNWEFLERISPIAERRLPALVDAPIAHAWAGLYEVTPDAMPIIGPASEVDGFFIIGGFSGHGFQHCPAAGRIIAEMIARGEASGVDAAQFSLSRFSNRAVPPETNVV